MRIIQRARARSDLSRPRAGACGVLLRCLGPQAAVSGAKMVEHEVHIPLCFRHNRGERSITQLLTRNGPMIAGGDRNCESARQWRRSSCAAKRTPLAMLIGDCLVNRQSAGRSRRDRRARFRSRARCACTARRRSGLIQCRRRIADHIALVGIRLAEELGEADRKCGGVTECGVALGECRQPTIAIACQFSRDITPPGAAARSTHFRWHARPRRR